MADGYNSSSRLLDRLAVLPSCRLAVLPSCRLAVLPSCRLSTPDFLQKCQRPALVRVQPRFTHVVAIEEAELAVLIAKEDGGVDVRGPANGARVAEARGHSVDRGDDVRLHR